jgi:hypothetical protein
MTRIFACLAFVLTIAGCASTEIPDTPTELGNFALGHNIAVAPDLVKGPLSREATAEELTDAMKAAMQERFGRYEGDHLYHFGINVSGYVLAQPGVPILFSPKSALVITVSVWDENTGQKLNEEAMQLTVSENVSGESFVGSGLTTSREEQIANLTFNAARAVERWLLKNPEWLDFDK